jgi:hypothetical protein
MEKGGERSRNVPRFLQRQSVIEKPVNVPSCPHISSHVFISLNQELRSLADFSCSSANSRASLRSIRALCPCFASRYKSSLPLIKVSGFPGSQSSLRRGPRFSNPKKLGIHVRGSHVWQLRPDVGHPRLW